MKPLEHCRLYTFVDAGHLHGRDPLILGRQLCEGGSDLIQLRAKSWPPARILEIAEGLRRITRETGTKLVINDHPRIAIEADADFCHLGQEDFFEGGDNRVSELIPKEHALRFGLSTHAPSQAERAVAAGAAYVAIGPVHATPTKPGVPPVTLDYVRWAAANLALPWFAIGGIRLDNLDSVLAAGARRVCVVSAILDAPDVAGACQRFRERLVSAP
jgi:thiamine-phosphate pyrophosphorylase